MPTSAGALQALDVSKKAGILETSRTWGANVHDFDGDGWSDMLLSRHGDGPARLYRNTGRGGFEEVQAGTFVEIDRHDCDWADVNDDDRPDAFCALGGGAGTRQGPPDELWIQQADGTFVDEASEYGIDGSYDRGRRTTFIDVNHDMYPDLYVGNGYPRQDGRLSLNRLFINEGGRAFVTPPSMAWTTSSAVNRSKPSTTTPTVGEFSSTVPSRSLEHGQDVAAGDVDGDFDQDLYVLQSGPNGGRDQRDRMLLNDRGLAFSRTRIPQTRKGLGEPVAAIDYDRNVLSDFVVLNGHAATSGPVRLVAFEPDPVR